MRTLLRILVILLSLGSSACWWSHRCDRGIRPLRLSEAAERAAEADAEAVPARRDGDKHRHATADDDDDGIVLDLLFADAADDGRCAEPAPIPMNGRDDQAGPVGGPRLRVGRIVFDHAQLDSGTVYGLELALYSDDQIAFALGFEFGDLAFAADSPADRGMSSPWSFVTDLSAVYRFHADRPGFGPGLGLGVGRGMMRWDYRRDLNDTDGRHISGDGLECSYVEVIGQVNLLRGRHVNLLVDIRPRYWLFAGRSSTGFADDLFDGVSSVVMQGAVDWLF